MRELKYRVWDTLRKEYLSAGTVSIEIHRGKNPVIKIILDNKWVITNNRFILEQYIGLKDKNGKEIYENDICKWISTEGNAHTWPIVWDDEKLCWCHNNMPFSDLFDSGYYQPSREWPSGLEIIGNTHENQVLLNGVEWED